MTFDLTLQGRISYDLVGDYPAQDFFRINKENAEIRVRKDLKTDSLRSATYVVRGRLYELNIIIVINRQGFGTPLQLKSNKVLERKMLNLVSI